MSPPLPDATAPAPRFLRTLTGQTLLRLALAGGLLLLAVAALNAWVLYRQSEREAMQRLAAAAAERARVAERVLGNTVETHETVRRAFVEQWPAYQDHASAARLDRILARYPDGAWRNRRELADGTVHPTGWVPPGAEPGDELRRKLVLFWDLSSRYGPGAAIRRDNLFFMSVPEQSNLGYDPVLFPNWVFDIGTDFDQLAYEWGRLAYRPARPGEGARFATPRVDDVGPALGPMFQVLTPIHVGERHVATVATTLLLQDFMARAMPPSAEARYLLYRPADGRLFADTGLAERIQPSIANASLEQAGAGLGAALLPGRAQHASMTGYASGSDVYFASARIDGPGWHVAALLPGAQVRGDALRVALWALAAHAGVLALLAALLAWILRRQVAAPLGALTRAAERVAGGQPDARAPTARADELARLARAFNDMAGKVAERDAALRRDKQEIEAALTSLRYTEERWRAMTDNASDFIAVIDEAGRILTATPPVQRMLGHAREALVGRMLFDWVHPDDVAALRSGLARQDGAALQFRARHADGRWRELEAVGSDARAHPAVGGVVLNIRDVTETMEVERQLRQAQKLEAIGTLAGGIAHDFNNILGAILGYGELARKAAADGSPQQRHIDAALAAGQRAKSLVQRILAFSRSGLGERQPVPVQAVVEEALAVVAATLPAGVRLVPALNAPQAVVMGDPSQVHQVVLNLCVNAVQALGEAGGRIDVRLEPLQLDAPLAAGSRTLPAGPAVRLAVQDTGSGIDPALADRIFDPFFTTKAVGVGTGLGLSLVHGIVADLGGAIEVDSRPGEGSCFAVVLPLSLPVPPAALQR